MPGYTSTPQANQVLNGNNVAITVGGVVVAFAQTVGHQVPMGAAQLYGIGTSKPQEVQQLVMSPQISVDSFALTQTGVDLLTGGTDLFFSLAGRVYDLDILDGTVTPNRTMFSYVGCKAQNPAETIPTNAPIRRTITFLAMDVLDPDGNSIMDTGDNAINVVTNLAAAAIGTANLGV